jgi:hypothetical protein
MSQNETTAFGCNPNAAHEKPDPTTTLDRNLSPRKSTREARLIEELRAAALALTPGRVAFVTTASTRGWFRVERLDALTARVVAVSESAIVEALAEEADFLAAEPLGCVA